MSAPRKITAWGTGRKLSLLGGSPDFQHTYHHDDVVRELVEALERAEQAIKFSLPLADGPKSETAALMLFRAQAEARIALAKIAQEG